MYLQNIKGLQKKLIIIKLGAQMQNEPKTLKIVINCTFCLVNELVALGEITSLGCTPQHLQVSVES